MHMHFQTMKYGCFNLKGTLQVALPLSLTKKTVNGIALSYVYLLQSSNIQRKRWWLGQITEKERFGFGIINIHAYSHHVLFRIF